MSKSLAKWKYFVAHTNYNYVPVKNLKYCQKVKSTEYLE